MPILLAWIMQRVNMKMSTHSTCFPFYFIQGVCLSRWSCARNSNSLLFYLQEGIDHCFIFYKTYWLWSDDSFCACGIMSLHVAILSFDFCSFRCDQRHMPVVTDVEFDQFLREHAPTQQLLIVHVSNSRWEEYFVVGHYNMPCFHCWTRRGDSTWKERSSWVPPPSIFIQFICSNWAMRSWT